MKIVIDWESLQSLFIKMTQPADWMKECKRTIRFLPPVWAGHPPESALVQRPQGYIWNIPADRKAAPGVPEPLQL